MRDTRNRERTPDKGGKEGGREAQEKGAKEPRTGGKSIKNGERASQSGERIQQQKKNSSKMGITSPEKGETKLSELPPSPPRFSISFHPVMWKIDISPGSPRPIADVILKLPQIRKPRIFITPKPVLSPSK